MPMMKENSRVGTLRGYGILDTPNEPPFDAIVKDAAQSMNTPIALISLIDQDRQWFKAKVGLEASETPRTISFCTHAITRDDVFVVPDALADPRFSSNPLVQGQPGIRFYAGAPLKSRNGALIGTLCVIDTQPRLMMRLRQRLELAELAERVMAQIEIRRKSIQDASSR